MSRWVICGGGLLLAWCLWGLAPLQAQLSGMDRINTVGNPWVLANDTVVRTLTTQTGFEVLMENVRRVGPRKGYVLAYDDQAYYLHIIRTKEFQVNGTDVPPATQIIEKKIPLNRPRRERQVITESGDTLTQKEHYRQELEAYRANKKARREARRIRQHRKHWWWPLGKPYPPGYDPEEANREPAYDPNLDRMDGNEPDPLELQNGRVRRVERADEPEEAPEDTLKKLKPPYRWYNPWSWGGRNNKADSSANDSTQTDSSQTEAEEPEVPEYRIERAEEELYVYFAVVSNKRKLDKRIKKFYSRAQFLKGIVDRTDSIPMWREGLDTLVGQVDSIHEFYMGRGGEFRNEAEAEETHALVDRIDRLDKRLQFYTLLRKYDNRPKRLLQLFLSHWFYSTDLKYNIVPRPFGLPMVRYLPEPPPEPEVEKPEENDLDYFRFSIKTPKKEKKKKSPKVKYKLTDEIQTAPGQVYAGDEGAAPEAGDMDESGESTSEPEE